MKTRVRAASYFLSIIAIAAIFFSVEHFIEKFFFQNDDLVDIIAAIVAALSFSECRRFFDRATDRIFFRGSRDARADLFTNLSHELQTPIAILRGNVELLQRRNITEVERTVAERVILSTLDGMSRLIGGVLESTKLRFSGQAIYYEQVALDMLLREVHEGCLLLAEDKGIYLSVEMDEARDMTVRGDPCKLKEVIFNLISNALKYTACGGSIVLRGESDGTMARIVVEDTGSGIPPEELPHIFERFYRIRNGIPADAAADGVASNGIGLNICKEIAEAHGGTIGVESDVGKGSRFIVALPLSSSSPPQRMAGSKPAPPSASAIINS